jgi:predicted 2-oxoglutarate/Fe(II)-dependent dioxygenase YbiX
MFDITKLALKIPNFLTHEECDGLINEFEQKSNEYSLESSLDYNTNQRKQSSFKVVSLIPQTSNFKLIKTKTKQAVDSYINYLDQPKYFFTHLLKNALKFSHNYRIMKYEEGAEIHPHSDYDPGIYGSISFNLNGGYKGGEFKFFNGNYTISLNKGDALIFPADYFWVHEVTPVTEGVRYSLNSFLLSSPILPNNQGNDIKRYISDQYIINTPPEELLGPYN